MRSGAVLVDGVDVQDYDQQALRSKIAITLQKAELFSAPIAENISWGKPDAGQEEIRTAVEIAQADSFISTQADSYNTLVAERGLIPQKSS